VFVACCCQTISLEIVRTLLQFGGDVNKKSRLGYLPIDAGM